MTFCNTVQVATQIIFSDDQDEADEFYEDLIDALRKQRKKYKLRDKFLIFKLRIKTNKN